jgi:hypothetical protein
MIQQTHIYQESGSIFHTDSKEIDDDIDNMLISEFN